MNGMAERGSGRMKRPVRLDRNCRAKLLATARRGAAWIFAVRGRRIDFIGIASVRIFQTQCLA